MSEIGLDLAELYFLEKEVKSDLAKRRQEFFDYATAKNKGKLATKTIEGPSTPEHVEKYNPGWILKKYTKHKDGDKNFILEEDPALKPWQEAIWVDGENGVWDSEGHWHPGYVISKTIRSGQALVDDERLKNEDPDLWQAVTEYPNEGVIRTLLLDYLPDEESIGGLIEKYFGGLVSRQMKPLELLTPDQVEALKAYMYEGPKTVALNVRYAKEDELGEG